MPDRIFCTDITIPKAEEFVPIRLIHKKTTYQLSEWEFFRPSIILDTTWGVHSLKMIMFYPISLFAPAQEGQNNSVLPRKMILFIDVAER